MASPSPTYGVKQDFFFRHAFLKKVSVCEYLMMFGQYFPICLQYLSLPIPIGYTLLAIPCRTYINDCLPSHSKAPNRQYKAPTGNKKPQKTIQSRDRLYEAPSDYTKTPKDFTPTHSIRQKQKY